MKNNNGLLNKIVDMSFGKFFLIITMVLPALEAIYIIIGMLLAIPTDFGRIFLFSMTSFTLTIYIYFLVCFILLKFLIKLRRMSEKITINANM